MVERKQYVKLEQFTTIPIKYDTCLFKFRQFLRQESGLVEHLDYITKLAEPPTDQTMSQAPGTRRRQDVVRRPDLRSPLGVVRRRAVRHGCPYERGDPR